MPILVKTKRVTEGSLNITDKVKNKKNINKQISCKPAFYNIFKIKIKNPTNNHKEMTIVIAPAWIVIQFKALMILKIIGPVLGSQLKQSQDLFLKTIKVNHLKIALPSHLTAIMVQYIVEPSLKWEEML
jgi:hypothetical protein